MATRRTKVTSLVTIRDPRFEGTRFSNAELAFLIEHLGKSPIEIFEPYEGEDGEELPLGVNDAAVEPLLERVSELETYQELMRKKHDNPDLMVYCGIEAIIQVCRDTLKWRETVSELKRKTRGANPELIRSVGAPSLHMWDQNTGIPYLGGIGADGDMVITAIGKGGIRTPLYQTLQPTAEGTLKSIAGVADFLTATSPEEQQQRVLDQVPDALIIEGEAPDRNGTIKCPICGKSEEFTIDLESTKRSAMQRMMKHLKAPSTQKEVHRMFAVRLNSGRSTKG